MKKRIFCSLICIAAFAMIYMQVKVVYCDPASGVYGGDFRPGSEDDTIYGTVEAGISPSEIDADLYDMATKNGFTTSAIEYALNNGYMLGYIDLLKQGGWIPQDFTPAGSSSSNNSSGTNSSGNSSVSGNSSSGSSSSSSGSSSSNTKKTEPTKDDSVTGAYIVVNNDTSVYDSYSASNEEEAYGIGTEVEVTGLYSNGMYEITYNDGKGYIRQKNLIAKEEYEANWEVTETVEATCSNAGKTVYTNKLSGATKEEEIPVLEHSYEVTETVEATCTEDGKTVYTCLTCGDTYEEVIEAIGHTEGEWEVVKEASVFSKGEKVKKCTVCGKILETEEIAQSLPPLWSLVVIFIACIGVFTVILVVCKKKKENAKLDQK